MLFGRLRPGLAALRAADRRGGAAAAPGAGRSASRRTAQLALSRRVAGVFGYDWEAGRLDLAVHPSSSGTGGDVRITTRIDEADPSQCLYSTIHEVGHAVYEQGARPGAGAAAGRRLRLDGGAREPVAAVREPARPQPRLLRLALPGDARGLRRHRPRWRREALYRGGQRGGDRLHPHRRRRGALQPPRHAALRPRAGADRGRPRGRATSRPPGTTASSPTSAAPVPDRPARGAAGRALVGRRSSAISRPTRSATSMPPSSTPRCAATCRTSTPGSPRATSPRRSAGSAPASTAAAACSPPRALIAEATGREPDARTLVG